MCPDSVSLARRVEKAGDTASLWKCLLMIPGQQQRKSLALGSVPLSHLTLSSLTYPTTFSSPLCLRLFQLQMRKTPNQLASKPISHSAGQSAVQRALPIIIWFSSCCSAGVFPLHMCHDVGYLLGLNQYTFDG